MSCVIRHATCAVSSFKLRINDAFVQDITHENRLRLLMILASIYPEKFEGEKGLNLMRVWFLSDYKPNFH